MCDIVYGVISVYGGDGCTVDISRRSTKTLYAKWLRDEDVENSQDRRGIWGGGGDGSQVIYEEVRTCRRIYTDTSGQAKTTRAKKRNKRWSKSLGRFHFKGTLVESLGQGIIRLSRYAFSQDHRITPRWVMVQAPFLVCCCCRSLCECLLGGGVGSVGGVGGGWRVGRRGGGGECQGDGCVRGIGTQEPC